MVVLAALLILHAAGQALQAPRTLDAPWYGLVVNGLATALNGAWCWVLLRQGRRLRSPALVADGQHLLADVVSSVGVGIGIVAAVGTGWLWLDPLLAVLVALNILWSGWQLIKSSLSSLLDEAVSAQELQTIEATIARTAMGALEAHDLRTRRAGAVVFVEFHLIVPGTMTVHGAHAICDHIEQALKAEDPHRVVTIHVEPEEKAKHHGVLVL
jgi:cation diffusion facilitator family transporter